MPIPTFIDEATYGQMPETGEAGRAIRSDYKRQEDGRYRLVLPETEGYGLVNVAGATSAATAARRERDEFERDLRELRGTIGDRDIAALISGQEELVRLRASQGEGSEEVQELKRQMEELRAQLKQESETAVASERETTAGVRKQLRTERFRNHATAAVLTKDEGVSGKRLGVLLDSMEDRVRYVDREGRPDEFDIEVLDRDGQLMYVTGEDGAVKKAGLKDLVADFHKDKEFGFVWTGGAASGSGAGPAGGGADGAGDGDANPFDWRKPETYNISEQAKIKKADPALAKQLQAKVPPRTPHLEFQHRGPMGEQRTA